MKRGDIYWAELKPRSGSEQQGNRPVIVMSHDGFNQAPGWRSVIVVPCSTSVRQLRRGPTVLPLLKGTAGLKTGGAAIAHQVTTLDRSKLTRKIGALPAAVLRELEQCVLAAMDIER